MQEQRDFQGKVRFPKKEGSRKVSEKADFPEKTRFAVVIDPSNNPQKR